MVLISTYRTLTFFGQRRFLGIVSVGFSYAPGYYCAVPLQNTSPIPHFMTLWRNLFGHVLGREGKKGDLTQKDK